MKKMWTNWKDRNIDESDPMYRYNNEGIVAWLNRTIRDKGYEIVTEDIEYEEVKPIDNGAENNTTNSRT